MISKLTILEMGDIHLGHRRTSTEHIVENLERVLNDNGRMSTVDWFIIAGDLFDRLLPLSNPDVSLCHLMIHKLFAVCAKHDIVLRVLEGTPSHDNRQPRMMQDVLHTSGLTVDFKYVDTLSIEYIEKFDISVLYIPDEWNPNCSDTLLEVREAMSKQRLTQVDFAVMHGQFDVQLPANLRKIIPHHDSSAYLSLVKHLVFIGHVHTPSVNDRIIAAGSFDRLSHGEEEDKGCVYVVVHDTGEFDFTFLVNHGAKKYLTYDYQGDHTETTVNELRDKLLSLPDDSYVRIKVNSDDPLAKAIDELASLFPCLNITVQTEKVSKVTNPLKEIVKPTMVGLRLESLPDMLQERMAGRFSEEVIKDAKDYLVELLRSNHDKQSQVT